VKRKPKRKLTPAQRKRFKRKFKKLLRERKFRPFKQKLAIAYAYARKK
jgi:hypothetical protein